jgi:hypothetical protein
VKSRWITDENGDIWGNCFFAIHAPSTVALSKMFNEKRDLAIGTGFRVSNNEFSAPKHD